jgi:hypothetical protein
MLAVVVGAGAQQFVPKGAPPEARPDSCALGKVSATDLESLRGMILELLAKQEAARESFLKAEANLPQDCVRVRAIFYLQALPRARGAG